MKCSNCKKEIPDSAKVCGYCGTKQAQPVLPKKAVPRAKKPEKTTLPAAPSAQKGSPKWLLSAVFAVLAIIAVILVWKFVISPNPAATPAPEVPAPSPPKSEVSSLPEKSESESVSEPAAPETTETEPADEQAPLQEPVNCWAQKTIEADRGFQLNISWLTDTKEQALHFIEVANFDISVNGEPVVFTKAEGPFPYYDYEDRVGNLKDGYRTDYLSDILHLSAGTHSVIGKIVFLEKHFDGDDWFGPGTEYEVRPIECEIIAE